MDKVVEYFKFLIENYDDDCFDCHKKTNGLELFKKDIDEEKKEFHLKDKDQTYKPEQNKYAFKNRTDSYGGDDYITTNDIVDRVDERISSKFGGHNWFKGPEKLDSHNSYIYVKIDDGKDTTLAIKDIVKSEKNPRIVYVQTTDGEGMKSVDFGSKLSDMMYFLGRTIKGYLVIMNKSDESVYICNKIETKDNDVILSFEWGDLVDFSKELNEDAVDDTIADMKKVKSTNKENPDTKKTMNHTSSKTLTLMVMMDGRLKLIDADGYSMRRDDGGEMYFEDSNDAKEWAEERGYEVDDSIEREGLQEAEKDIGGEKSDIADELQGMKIWIDDVREAPEGFKWFKTVNDFIDWCYRKQDLSDVALIDTDHDAGEMQEFGGDYIVCFKYLSACNCKNLTIHIHSANPVGANNIRSIIHSNEENGWKEIRNS